MTLRQIYELFKILFEKKSDKNLSDDVNLSCKMLKNGQKYLKILQYEHLKIFKVCVAIFQRYA